MSRLLGSIASVGLSATLVVGCRSGSEPSRPPEPALRTRSTPEPAPRRAEPAPPATVAVAPSAPSPEAPTTGETWPPRPLARVETDWCIAGLESLDVTTCVVVPSSPTRTLLIYLHGIVPPGKDSPQKTNVETIVANASRRAGIVAMIPRGRKGLAPKGLSDWWGWPTGEASYRRYGTELATEISDKRARLETALGVRFDRVYLAGSSSGAYFVSMLALHGGLEVNGFGAMSGGARVLSPKLSELAPRPFYIGYGTYDTVGDGARALGKLLRASGWPVRVSEHRVGHGAKEVYLDEAFAFFDEQSK